MKNRVAGIQIDSVVGVLPPLGHDHPGVKLLAVQLQVVGYLERIADLLDHDHIGPE